MMCFLMKDMEKVAKELSDQILGLLMRKTINYSTYNKYKNDVYDLILKYLKSNS